MILVATALRHYFHLSTVTPAKLRVVGIRGNADFFHRLFVRGDHHCAAPVEAVYGNSVDLEAVASIALAVGINLYLIFRREDGFCPLGTARALAARRILRVAPGSVLGITEHSGR